MYTPIEIMRNRSVRRYRHFLPVVYLAEDDPDLREALTTVLTRKGLVVRAASDGMQLFDWLFRRRDRGTRLPDVIVTDHRMPGYCSLDILQCLVERQWTIPVIVLTAFGPEVRGLAMAYGARTVLDKPFDPEALCEATMGCINWDVRRLPERASMGLRSAT
jgi:DNA-binding response OmpR family regulator